MTAWPAGNVRGACYRVPRVWDRARAEDERKRVAAAAVARGGCGYPFRGSFGVSLSSPRPEPPFSKCLAGVVPLSSSNLGLMKIMEGDEVGVGEGVLRCTDVIMRYPGLCRYSTW